MSAAGNQVMGVINNLFNTDLSITAWDFLAFLAFGLLSFFYALLFVSRGKLVPILFSTYVSLVLVQLAPFLNVGLGERLGIGEIWQLKLIAFGVIFILMLVILSRVVFQSPVGAETFGMIGSFILSITQIGFLIAVLVSFLPPEITNQLSRWTAAIFLDASSLFYWAAASIFFLLIFGRVANKEVR